MPASESSNLQFRLVCLILTGIFYLAVLGFLWSHWNWLAIPILLGGLVLGATIRLLQPDKAEQGVSDSTPISAGPSKKRFRRVGSILTALGYLALLGIVWSQVGPQGPLTIIGVAALVAIVRLIQKTALSTRLSPCNVSPIEGERRESKFAPVPADPSREQARLARQFVGGLLYLAFISLFLAAATETNFFLVFGAVTAGVVFTAAIILVWAASRASRADGRPRQFSILTLLFLTRLAAIYLGTIRWFADLAGERLGAGEQTFLAAAVICLILTGFSLPFLLFFMESLVWLAAWLVRRPWVQRRLRTRIAKDSPAAVENEKPPELP